MHGTHNICQQCMYTLRKQCICARACTHMQRCNSFLAMKLLRTYLESQACASIVQAVVCRPACLLSRRNRSPDAIRQEIRPNPCQLMTRSPLQCHTSIIRSSALVQASSCCLWVALAARPRRLPVTEMLCRHFRASNSIGRLPGQVTLNKTEQNNICQDFQPYYARITVHHSYAFSTLPSLSPNREGQSCAGFKNKQTINLSRHPFPNATFATPGTFLLAHPTHATSAIATRDCHTVQAERVFESFVAIYCSVMQCDAV